MPTGVYARKPKSSEAPPPEVAASAPEKKKRRKRRAKAEKVVRIPRGKPGVRVKPDQELLSAPRFAVWHDGSVSIRTTAGAIELQPKDARALVDFIGQLSKAA